MELDKEPLRTSGGRQGLFEYTLGRFPLHYKASTNQTCKVKNNNMWLKVSADLHSYYLETVCILWAEKMRFIRGIKHTLISFTIGLALPSLPSHSRPLVLFNYLRDIAVCTLP